MELTEACLHAGTAPDGSYSLFPTRHSPLPIRPLYSFVQAAFFFDDLTQASTKATPSTPSWIVG